MKRTGRPLKTLPPNGLEVIRQIARTGATETSLAAALGLSYTTWTRIKNENPKAKAAWEEARSIERDLLVGELFRQAMEDHNTVAAIALLKLRHGMRDSGPADGSDGGARVGIVLNIPAALDPARYQQLVEVHQTALPGAPRSEAA